MIPIAPHLPKQQSFIGTKCFLCGRANQSLFTLAQIYIDYVTLNYSDRSKFYQKEFIPSVSEIKVFIWSLSSKNPYLIELAKKATNFTPHKTDNIFSRLAWFKVYQYIRDFLNSQTDGTTKA